MKLDGRGFDSHRLHMTQQATTLLEGHLLHFERQRDKLNNEIESLNNQMDGKKELKKTLDRSIKDIRDALELIKK